MANADQYCNTHLDTGTSMYIYHNSCDQLVNLMAIGHKNVSTVAFFCKILFSRTPSCLHQRPSGLHHYVNNKAILFSPALPQRPLSCMYA